MKAAYVREPGPASSIIYGDLEKPTPKSGEVLVKINVAAINPIDTYVRSGAVKMPIPLPYIIGTDFAGVVESVGPDVFRFHPGDRVWGSNQGLMGRQGVAADYAAIPAEWIYPTHPLVTDDTAAGLALVSITAHLGLCRDAHLREGETLFVSGGTGGVGSAVVQMAKAIGARVITTASTTEKEQLAKQLGADVVINYKTTDVGEAVKAAAPNGVDVWWETVRDPNLEVSIPLLAKRGRLVLIAGRDAKPVLPLGAFYPKDCKIIGFAMFNASPDEQHICAEEISRWAAEGKLHANIGRVMPLSEAAAAHQLQEDNSIHKHGTNAGKILLKP